MAFNRRVCVECGASFFPNRSGQVRCVVCREAHRRELRRLRGLRRTERHRAARAIEVQTCAACHLPFKDDQARKYCRRVECQRARNTARMHQYFERYEARTGTPYEIKRSPGTRQRNGAERRAYLRGAHVGDPFTREYIGERDSWQCALCGNPIDSLLKWPDPQSQSLEHIVPLSLGGEHSKENCTIAHLSCNSRGGTRHRQARQRMLRRQGNTD